MDTTHRNFEKNLIFQSLYSAEHMMSQELPCIQKSSEYSQSFRKSGNEMYSKRNCDKECEEIHANYSKSIAYAPVDSDDLALGYGNRSALLHRIQKHEESILDIDRALEIDQTGITLRVKLLCRKVECLAALGSSECQKVYEELKYLVLQMEHENQSEKILETVKKAEAALENFSQVSQAKNKEVPEHMVLLQQKELENPFDTLAVQYDEQYGRHLIASRDIKPGEMIFVEKPYVGCLNGNKGTIYCGHCYTRTWASIPCDYCNWCMYCSEKCKKLAWMNYHDIECSVISYLMSNEHHIDYAYHLALRSLIMGVKESGSITNFVTEIESVDEWIDQLQKKENLGYLFKNGIISNNGFQSIYSLCGQYPSQVLRTYAIDAITILIILCKYTNFFGQNVKFEEAKDLQKNNDVVFIGSVFLKLWHRSNLSFNTVHDANSDCKRSNGSINCSIANCTKGACIPPMSFFFNHSCYPNVKKFITDDYKVIFFSLMPIKRDTQLFIAYQQPFFEVEKPARQKQLDQNLDFTCDCIACTQNWPTLKQLWRMPKEKPKLYIKNYSKIESDLFDKYDKLVRPIIINCQKAQYNQAQVRKIANAIEKAATCLQQPSVVMSELMICICLLLKKLYCSRSS